MTTLFRKFEGIIIIKWYENDSGGDRRCISIDCKDRKELKTELAKIKKDFMTLGGTAECPEYAKYWIGKLPYSVKFEFINERK